MFKFLKFLGALVLVAGVGIGGYFLYDRVLKDKISEWKGEELQLIYSYETLTGLDSDKTPYGLVKGYQGVAPEEIIVEDSFEDNGTKRAVVAVKSNAFKNARKTKKIEFPASVAIFGYNVFKGCDNLETAIFKMPKEMAPSIGFYGSFDTVDWNKTTFYVTCEEIQESMVSAYADANVVVDPALA